MNIKFMLLAVPGIIKSHVSELAQATIKKYHRLGGLNDIDFLTVVQDQRINMVSSGEGSLPGLFFSFLSFFFFAISWAAPAAYGGSQARG